MVIICSNTANKQIDEIYANKHIYDRYWHFTKKFINWNYEFNRYVNKTSIEQLHLSQKGLYQIGSIGILEYNYFTSNDSEIFEIIEFRFTRLPYDSSASQEYTIIGDAGYHYKIARSNKNGLSTILKPNGTLLTKYFFDDIIGFHHASHDFNVLYAIGFKGDRVYKIYTDGNIELERHSKQQYLSMKHNFYESKQHIHIKKSQLVQLIKESIKRYLNVI